MLYCNIFLFDYFVFVMNYFSLNNKSSYNVWQKKLETGLHYEEHLFICFFLDSLEASFWSCFRFILGRCSTKSFQLFAKILFYHDITKII